MTDSMNGEEDRERTSAEGTNDVFLPLAVVTEKIKRQGSSSRSIIADVTPSSAQNSQIYEEFFRGQGH